MTGMFVWLISFLVVHFIAKDVVRFLALNVVHSQTTGIGCCKFEWDLKLQIATYSLYAAAFLLLVWLLIEVRKRMTDSVTGNRILLVVFIMSFPTHTFWGVASNCKGVGGCSDGSYFHIVVPTIMSTNPIAILLSALVAYQISRMYINRNA